jgi:hypothetical protein
VDFDYYRITKENKMEIDYEACTFWLYYKRKLFAIQEFSFILDSGKKQISASLLKVADSFNSKLDLFSLVTGVSMRAPKKNITT